MALGRATLRCGLIWFLLGSGIVRAGYVLRHGRSSGRVLIGKLVSGAVDSGLAMGWEGIRGRPRTNGSVRTNRNALEWGCRPIEVSGRPIETSLLYTLY